MQGGHLTHFRKSRLQASQPRALLLAHFCPGSETMLGWAPGGSRACRVSSLLRTGAHSLSAASLCRGSSSELLSGDLFLQTSRVKQSQGDRCFPDIVSPGSLGTEQERFWNKQHKYIFTHTHTIGCVLTVWDGSTLWFVLPLGPASKGKMETVTHSARKKPPVLALLSPLLTSM